MLWTIGRNKYLFFLVFYILFQFSSCNLDTCYLQYKPSITVVKENIIIEPGRPLTIYCKLHDDFSNNYLFINSDNIEFIGITDTIQPEWVTQVNRSTAQLYIKTPPPSNYLYICKLKFRNNSLCVYTGTIGVKPTGVQNFSCISNNYENMTCSWIEPEHYVETTYNLTYYFMGRSRRHLYDCKITRVGNKGSCYWDMTTQPHYRQAQSIYYFEFHVSNEFGNITQQLTTTHFAIVIPAPPENLKVLNKTSDSVTLSWSISHGMLYFPPSVFHRMVYRSDYDKNGEWHVANTTSINKNNTPIFTLTGLKYANYTIRVSMISTKAEITNEKMWSKNASISVRTMSALPGEPPKTNIGSFEVLNINHLAEEGRAVYLYWQSVPDQLKNGEYFRYKIIPFEILDNTLVEKQIFVVETTNSYARIRYLRYDKKYRFNIVSVNEVGQSVNSSHIIVPEFDKKVEQPSSLAKVSLGKQVYELSWIPPQTNYILKNYTIFYCRNDYDRPYQCKGYLDWIVVASHVTVINITVPEDKMYQFAISANFENFSSGMVWTSCTVLNDKGFSKIKKIWTNNIGSNFMEIGWKLDCSARIGSIKGYIIRYCPIVSPIYITCQGNESNLTINANPLTSRFKITNLVPYTTYMFVVSPKYECNNNNVLPSDPVFNTTLEGAPDPPENLAISNINSDSLALHWQPPKNINGVLRYYEVRYSHDGREYIKRPEDETSTVITLTNLKSDTLYNIGVIAATVKESEPAEMIVQTAPLAETWSFG